MLRNAGREFGEQSARDRETGVSQVEASGVMQCRHEVSRESCLPTLITVTGSGSADNVLGYWKHSTHSYSLGMVNGLICYKEKNSHHHNVLRTTDLINNSFKLNASKTTITKCNII